jgi:hypothetical protein
MSNGGLLNFFHSLGPNLILTGHKGIFTDPTQIDEVFVFVLAL